VVAKSKLVATSSTKSVCSVVAGSKVKGLKAGICRLTVKITPPPTKEGAEAEDHDEEDHDHNQVIAG